MSTVSEVLARARQHGMKFEAPGDRLKMKAPHRPPDELVGEVRAHKSEILALLRNNPGQAPRKPQDCPTAAEARNHPDTPSPPSAESLDRQQATDLAQDTFEERAATVEYGAGVPREWAEGFARLDLASRPKDFREDRWRTLIDDAGKFLDRWGAEAAKLGWETKDVFGVHPIAPGARYDAAGLVMLIGGGEVVSIKSDRATIQRKGTGSLLTYPRTPRAGVVALWDVAPT